MDTETVIFWHVLRGGGGGWQKSSVVKQFHRRHGCWADYGSSN